MAAVTLRGVSKTYRSASGTVQAVKGVDLEVGDGELVVLVGPSGCGKTTTLRLIAGLEDASEGEILIGSQVVNRLPPKDRNIAMVFQNYALYPHLSVRRNLAFGLELRYRSDWWARLWLGMTQPRLAAELAEKRSGIHPRVEQAAEMLGIKHLLDRLPGQLSGGEQQRVALGRAMVRQPAAFLLDEPLSNLDVQLRGEMRRELKRLHQELRATMVYVTHDQTEAMTLGDRIAVMNAGEVRQIGTPQEIYDRPQDCFVARFVGSPPMNLAKGTLEENRFVAGSLQLACGLASRKTLILGIRPEDVRVHPEDTGCLAGEIQTTEFLGDSTLAHLLVGEHRLTAKVGGRTAWTKGERVGVKIDPERLHWFDTDTERRIE